MGIISELQANPVAHALLLREGCSFSCPVLHAKLIEPKPTQPTRLLEQHMSGLTKRRFFFTQTRFAETARMSLRLAPIVAGLLLTTMSFLTGCGDGGETGSDPTVTATPASTGATASLAWNPVPDPSVSAYFVHYGRQSPRQSGSCAYEHSIFVDSPSATLTSLVPDTHYYFAVSAYNGLESACSNEVWTLTSPPSI